MFGHCVMMNQSCFTITPQDIRDLVEEGDDKIPQGDYS